MRPDTREQRTVPFRLKRDEFPAWDALVAASPHGTVFHYSWWLEAAGWPFDILVCRDVDSGRLIGGIPLPSQRRAGLFQYDSPPLTPFLGPVFAVPRAAGRDDVSRMRKTGEALARNMGRFDRFAALVGPRGPDLQGFLWSGFRAELAYTFLFERGTSEAQVRERMSPKYRPLLERALRDGIVAERSADIETLAALQAAAYARGGPPMPYADDAIHRLWQAASARGRSNLYVARHPSGAAAAALLVVHDDRSSYQLSAGVAAEYRKSAAGNLLEWQAIGDALAAGRAYDFEGSHLRGVEQHYRHWGAQPCPIYLLRKTGSWKGLLADAASRSGITSLVRRWRR